MARFDVHHVFDKNGRPTSVIVPLQLWQEIQSELETSYLLKNPAMKKRLLKARQRSTGISFKAAREKLGI
jgi:hypothetical protein